MKTPLLDISVIFSTFKRGDTLKKTLESFLLLERDGLSFEILVVDNEDSRLTESIVRRFSTSLPIKYFVETKPGKNSALITGVSNAEGKLLIFTDDDILATKNWLREMQTGAERHPDKQIFGGRILPHYPVPEKQIPSEIDLNHNFLKSAYVIADWSIPEGPIKVGNIWGPNMAVKREVFDSGITFNPDIGPNGANYVMGSETEFLHRAHNNGFKAVYLPKSLVYHQIRIEQLNLNWFKGRAYRWGRGSQKRTLPTSRFMFLGAPMYLYRKFISAYFKFLLSNFTNKKNRFSKLIEFKINQGMITECLISKIKDLKK